MAVFDRDAPTTHALDYHLMANSYVTLFWRRPVLDETIGWLLAHGYQVVQFDAAAWRTENDLHRDFAAALGFPDYYGGVLAALNDCLSDVALCEYGARPDATGLVLVLTGYDQFTGRHPEVAERVLDIITENARKAMLVGHRMFCLVQSDDPRISFGPLGSTYARWNGAEWFDDSRGLA